MVVEAIIAAVDAQCVEQLEEDYVAYKNQNIRTMVKQLQAWYVITTKEKLGIKVHFFEPWSNTPDTYITTFARQLDRHQFKCKDHGVTITKADKVDHSVAQMYACNLFKANFLEDWEESDDKLWGATQPHFTKQYAKERCKLEHNKSNKSYKSSAAFQETSRPHTIKTPYYGSTATTVDGSFAAEMEYAAAKEEKANAQAKRILELEASVDGQTVLTKATKYAASALTAGGHNKDLK